MGSVDTSLAAELQRALGLERAIETGTYLGTTARKLAGVFPAVVTIELSKELHRDVTRALADVENVTPLQGHSVERLPELLDASRPTFYFLDGHWSAGVTEGADEECPLLRELAAIQAGHSNDCVVIDDARLFAAPPPPPHDPAAWPRLIEILDTVRAQRPDHHVTILEDQILVVPEVATPIVDGYGQRLLARQHAPRLRDRAQTLVHRVVERLRRRG